jgi:Spy/CpxP family protein refolding chaperone
MTVRAGEHKMGRKGAVMKNHLTIIALLILASAYALPVYAMGQGMGSGGMTGSFGSDLIEWFRSWRNGSPYTNPSGQKRKQMGEMDQQHDEDSAYLKYQIQMKERELEALLKSANPDPGKVRALHRDIRALRAEADQEQRNYELEAGKMNRGYRSGQSDGWSSYARPGRRESGGIGDGRHTGD